MTDERKPLVEYSAGCVECTAGFCLIETDDRGTEIQACGECTDHDDDRAALRFVRVAQLVAPDVLADLYSAVATECWRNPNKRIADGVTIDRDADGVITVTLADETDPERR